MRKEIYENQESSDTLPFHWEFGKEEITPFWEVTIMKICMDEVSFKLI